MRSRVGISLVLLIAIAATARAQRSVEIGPFVGYYRPLGNFDPNSVGDISLPYTPQDLAGLLVGVDGRVWLSQRLGLELQGALRNASVDGINPGFGTEEHASDDVQMLTTQLLVRTSTNGHRFWMGAGPAVVRHAGEGYSRYGSPTDLAGAASIGAEADIGRHLGLSAGANMLVYNLDLRTPPNLVNAKMQHGRMMDAAFRVGLMWFPAEP